MAYLDHAATTPMLDEALEAYVATAREVGNASSLHASGRRARRRVEESRERVAAVLGARPSEVIFTGGGTESDNLAVKGIFWLAEMPAPTAAGWSPAPSSTTRCWTRSTGWRSTRAPRSVCSRWTPSVGSTRRTCAPSCPRTPTGWQSSPRCGRTTRWAPSKPVAELAAVAAEHGVPFHTDAIQAVGQVPVDFAASGVAALTVTGHKLGGPAGVGALLLARDVAATPLLHGGGQERDIRSGTLDTAGIVAFAVAVEAAVKGQQEYAARVAALRDDLIERVRRAVPEVIYNGDPADRLPGNAHFSFPGSEGDALLLLLDAQGIACSTGSACSAGVAQPSHVLLAMGADDDRARSSLRFSLGHTSTQADVDAVVAALPAAVERARRAAALRTPR